MTNFGIQNRNVVASSWRLNFRVSQSEVILMQVTCIVRIRIMNEIQVFCEDAVF